MPQTRDQKIMTIEIIQKLFESKYSEETEMNPAELVKSRWLANDGYSLPRVNRAYRFFRDGYLAASGVDQCAPSED